MSLEDISIDQDLSISTETDDTDTESEIHSLTGLYIALIIMFLYYFIEESDSSADFLTDSESEVPAKDERSKNYSYIIVGDQRRCIIINIHERKNSNYVLITL